MTVSVDPVRDGRELDAFIRLPWSIYRDDPHWVPPLMSDVRKLLSPEHNPFFEHGKIECFLARRDGRVIGRIAAIRNRLHEEFHDEPCGFFGFFECEEDGEAAQALIETAQERVAEWGLSILRGPVNPSTNDECGTLVEGFDTPPMVMMPHGRPYYDALLKSCGLVKAKDLLAYWIVPPEIMPERLQRGAEIAIRRNPDIRFRCFDKKRFDQEVELFKEVYNAAWEKNWGFVPMTDAEIDHLAAELQQVLDPGLIRIAEHEGRAVAFSLALPDVNQALRHANGRLFPFGIFKILWHLRRIDRIRVMVLGVIEGYRGRGIDTVLYRDFFAYGMKKGYSGTEMSWVLEDNRAMLRPLENMGGRLYKTYRIYEMPVAHATAGPGDHESR